MMIFKILLLILIPSISLAQANEIPLYEGVNKTEKQKIADREFINEASKIAGSKEKAANDLILKAWDAISKRDISLAIKRFNQAYLLNPEDYRIYWGLGMTSSMSGDMERSEKLFSKGAELNKNDIRFLSDYGFALQQSAIYYAHRSKVDPRPKFEQAKKIFEKAIEIDSKQSLPHARLAVIHFYLGNCELTKQEVKLAESLGSEGLDPRFINDMKINCQK